jgi:Family of unknown function (DUF6152)
MKNRWKLSAALVLCFAVEPIWAHHSVKGTYDTSALVSLIGTVAKVDFVNPHVWFELTVKRENGQVITERVEIAAQVLSSKGALTKASSVSGILSVWKPGRRKTARLAISVAGP